MAIKFGIAKQEDDTIDDILDKAMANLQKFAGPIFKETLKNPSKTTTKTDPMAAKLAATKLRTDGILMVAEAEANAPSWGEVLLGGLSGAAQGYLTGQNMSTGAGAPEGTDTGKAIGAAVGGFLGSGSYSGGREGGKMGQQTLGTLLGISGEFKKNAQQKMAEDAVGTAVQRMGEINNPDPLDPGAVAKAAAEREGIMAQLATDLVASGLAPDKAIATAANIAAINAPNAKELQDPGLQAQRAIAAYQASGKTKQDKQKLTTTLNSIILGQGIKMGKMPANSGALLNQILGESAGAAAGQPAGGGADGSEMTVEPIDEQGNVVGPPVAVGQGAGGGGVAPPSGDPAAPNLGVDTNFLNKDDQAGHGFNQNALGLIGDMESMIQNGDLPMGPVEGAMWKLHDQGLSKGQGMALGAAAGGIGGGVAAGMGTLGMGAGAGAVSGSIVGSQVGAGLEGMGKGAPAWALPGLSQEEMDNMGQMEVLSTALETFLSKALDPKTGALRYEGEKWQGLLFDPTKTPEQNLKNLNKLKSIIQRIESNYASTSATNKAAGRAGGNMPKGGNTTKAKKAEPGLVFFN